MIYGFLTAHTLSLKQIQKIDFSHFVLQKKKSGGPFYTIYEKDREMSAWWSIIYEWKEAFVNLHQPLPPISIPRTAAAPTQYCWSKRYCYN